MNILEELYYGNISEVEKINKPTKNRNKQNTSYDNLYKTLDDEQKQLFNEFMKYEDLVDNELLIEKYCNGFKLGLLIGIESKDIEL